MAIEAAKLVVEIDAKTKGLEAGFARARSSFNTLKGDATNAATHVERETGRMGGAMSKLGGFVGGALKNAAGDLLSTGVQKVFGTVKGMVDEGMKFADTIEQSEVAFKHMLGSTDKARAHIREMAAFGARTPFQTNDLLRYSVALQNAGVAADDVKRALTGIGNAVAGTGSFDRMSDVIRGFTQILTKGKVSAEEMTQQIGEHGVDAWGFLSRGLGMEKREVQELGQQGRLNAEGAFRVMIDQMIREKGGLMEEMAQTRAGLESTKRDVMQMTAATALRGGDLFGTGGAFGASKDVSRQRIAALEGPEMQSFANVIGGAGEKYVRAEGWMEKQAFTQAAGREQFMNFVGAMPGMGQNIVGGVAGGIKSAATATTAAIGEWSQSMWGTLTSFWQTESPSKRTEQLGVWLGEGLERGLAQTGDAYQALLGLDGMMNGRGGGARLSANPLDKMSAAQRENARKVIEVGQERGESEERIKLALSTGWVESKFKNYTKAVDYDSLGIMQQRPSIKDKSGRPYWGTPAQLKDPAYAANRWYDEADRRDRGQDAATLGWQVQNPRKDLRGLYGKSMGVASQIYGALTAGGAEVSRGNPMPVQIVDGVDVTGLKWEKFKSQRPSITTDLGGAISDPFGRQRGAAQGGRMIYDPVSVVVDVTGQLDLLKSTTSDLITSLEGQLIPTTQSAAAALSGLTAAEVAANRAAVVEPGKAGKQKRDKLFDSQLTREGIAGDFRGELSDLLGNLGRPGQGGFKKQLAGFGMGLLGSIQQRAAADLSSMITGALFGGRNDKGGLSGGLLSGLFGSLFGGGGKGGSGTAGSGGIGGFFSKIFGSLFGGGKASGGSVRGDRFYMVGEQGPELFAPGQAGQITPNRQLSRSGSAGASRNLRLIMVDDERAARDHYNTSDEAYMLQVSRHRHEIMRMHGG